LASILVPTEEVVEVKGGHKVGDRASFLPGLRAGRDGNDDESWHLVKNTSKVTGFVGGARNRPARSPRVKWMKIMSQMQEGVEKPRPKTLFEVGEMVRVKDGPFTDFNGSVEEVNYEKSRVRVSVTIFGRATRSSWNSVRSRRFNEHSRSAPRRRVRGFALTVRVMAVEERQ
jgi:transcriptional antiterminator NusG